MPVLQRLYCALAIASLLSACATSSPDVIERDEAQRLSTVADAVVLNVRPVVIDGSQSGLGGAAGAAIGGIAGASVGGRREQAIVGVLGAVAGAVVGNTAERMGTREEAVELLLQITRTGERRAVVQATGNEQFQPGEAVLLVTSGGKVRVMKAPPKPDSPAAKPAAAASATGS